MLHKMAGYGINALSAWACPLVSCADYECRCLELNSRAKCSQQAAWWVVQALRGSLGGWVSGWVGGGC